MDNLSNEPTGKIFSMYIDDASEIKISEINNAFLSLTNIPQVKRCYYGIKEALHENMNNGLPSGIYVDTKVLLETEHVLDVVLSNMKENKGQ